MKRLEPLVADADFKTALRRTRNENKLRLAKVSVEDLKKEISRRQRKLPSLIAARDALSRQIAGWFP